MNNFSYINTKTPKNYKCCKCGASKCKLWREYNTFDPDLVCAKCASRADVNSIKNLSPDGRHESELGLTDQICEYIPAVPLETGDGYWGYTSVPSEGCAWWRKLPNFPVQ